MSFETLTLKSVRARPVVLELKRPVVARIATLTEWPLILIDLYTEEGVIGRSYLEPYIRKSMRYLIPALHDLGEMLKGRRLAPVAKRAANRFISLVTRACRGSRSPGSTWQPGTHWQGRLAYRGLRLYLSRGAEAATIKSSSISPNSRGSRHGPRCGTIAIGWCAHDAGGRRSTQGPNGIRRAMCGWS